jgi:hypothetical protein
VSIIAVAYRIKQTMRASSRVEHHAHPHQTNTAHTNATDKIRLNVRFDPKATELPHGSETTRRANFCREHLQQKCILRLARIGHTLPQPASPFAGRTSNYFNFK